VVGAFVQGDFRDLSLSTEFSRPLGLFLFLGRAFGDLRLLLDWFFCLDGCP
jgi:hypothetical protein